VVQDSATVEVLTLAYVSRESLVKTHELGETVFFSRSRRELWHKGETSGNFQKVVSIMADCDRDSLVIRVRPEGPACHTGARSCFFEEVEGFAAVGPEPQGGKT
jgi:phosphoribosyl-AMP cyclohydrolase